MRERESMIEGGVATLLRSPCSLIVGTVDASGVPSATRAFGLQILENGSRLRLLLTSTGCPAVDNLRATGAIAVTGTDVHTLDSVQVKGRADVVEPATDADEPLFAQYTDQFFAKISASDGVPRDVVERLRPHSYIAVEMTVEALFDQTPGPRAGRALSSADS